jgi:hypothetical protein
MKSNTLFLIALLFLFLSCSSDDKTVVFSEVNNGNGSDGSGGGGSGDDSGDIVSAWTIPIDEVIDGGPGKYGIPSIDNPVFLDASNLEVGVYMDDDDLVVGIVRGNVAKAYPHRILDWHEVVNDDVSGKKITISYCPLTGTAFGWESSVEGKFSEFGVSGLLYNANLILYDRESDSHWSQLKLECVNGEFIENKPKVVDVVETTWKLWKEMFPNTKILSDEQGFRRNYSNYPYGSYREDHDLILFPVSRSDNSIPNKDRVHAIISNESAKIFEFNSFTGGKAIKSQFLSNDILVVGNQEMIKSYFIDAQHSGLIFEYDFSSPEYYFKDNEGNKWNVLGVAVEGPRKGEVLRQTTSLMSYWFAIPPFFIGIDIYKD